MALRFKSRTPGLSLTGIEDRLEDLAEAFREGQGAIFDGVLSVRTLAQPPLADALYFFYSDTHNPLDGAMVLHNLDPVDDLWIIPKPTYAQPLDVGGFNLERFQWTDERRNPLSVGYFSKDTLESQPAFGSFGSQEVIFARDPARFQRGDPIYYADLRPLENGAMYMGPSFTMPRFRGSRRSFRWLFLDGPSQLSYILCEFYFGLGGLSTQGHAHTSVWLAHCAAYQLRNNRDTLVMSSGTIFNSLSDLQMDQFLDRYVSHTRITTPHSGIH